MLSPADFDMLFRRSDTERKPRRSRRKSGARAQMYAIPLSLPAKPIKRR